MNPSHLRITLGSLAFLAGLVWFYLAAFPLVWSSGTKDDLIDGLFMIPLVILMALPGVLMTYWGYKLLRAADVTALKWTLGTLVTAAVLLSASYLASLLPEHEHEPGNHWSSMLLFVLALLALPLYVLVLRSMALRLGMGLATLKPIIGKQVLGLLAVLLWLMLSDLLEWWQPSRLLSPDAPVELSRGIIEVLVPLVLAYGSYRLAVVLLKIDAELVPESKPEYAHE